MLTETKREARRSNCYPYEWHGLINFKIKTGEPEGRSLKFITLLTLFPKTHAGDESLLKMLAKLSVLTFGKPLPLGLYCCNEAVANWLVEVKEDGASGNRFIAFYNDTISFFPSLYNTSNFWTCRWVRYWSGFYIRKTFSFFLPLWPEFGLDVCSLSFQTSGFLI